MTNYEKVREFHKKFNRPLDIKNTPPEQEAFRISLIQGELDELRQAIANNDIANIMEELVDVLYAAYGTAAEYGFDIDKAFDLKHQSNMTKTETPGIGKLAKGSDFKPADFSELVRNWQK
ncbi:MAG: nucleoside triphosphate pyrophosphohydrolase family protein [Alphaproteobacteria bacterium]|nr:nucleoside triphosphate pyrophosphohydrolase family protein [Alphaproteobacteria bacterium]